MTTETTPIAERTLLLSAEECALLLQTLESALGETRVEVHHTRSREFREGLLTRERLLKELIARLRPEPLGPGA